MRKVGLCYVSLFLFVLFNDVYGGVPKGSLIATMNSPTGFKPVESFTIFDSVISFEDGGFYASQVKSLLKFKSRNIIIIKTSSGILCCSREAKIYILNKDKFIPVVSLSVGDVLLSHELKSYPVESVVDFQTTGEPITFFIFSLDKVYSYFQADSNGTAFLMHNVYDIVMELTLKSPEIIPELVKAAPVVAAATLAAGSTLLKQCTHEGRVKMRKENEDRLKEFHDSIGPEGFNPEEDVRIGEFFLRKDGNVCNNKGEIVTSISESRSRAQRARDQKKEPAPKEEKKSKRGKETVAERLDKSNELLGKKVKVQTEKFAVDESLKNALDGTATMTEQVAAASVATAVGEGVIPAQAPVELLGNLAVDPLVPPEPKLDTQETLPEPVPAQVQEVRDVPIDLSRTHFPVQHVAPEPAPTPRVSAVPNGPSIGDQFIDVSKGIGLGLGAAALGIGSALSSAALVVNQFKEEHEEEVEGVFNFLGLLLGGKH